MKAQRLKRAGFIIIVLAQLLLLLAIIHTRQSWVEHGYMVMLRTVPMDPRSLMRGDYVRLNYDISIIYSDNLPTDGQFKKGEDIYVGLGAGADGVHGAISLWHAPPEAGHPFIKGRVSSSGPRKLVDIIFETGDGEQLMFTRIQRPWMFSGKNIGHEYYLCLASDGRLADAHDKDSDYANSTQCDAELKQVSGVLRHVITSKPHAVEVDYTIDSYFVEEGTGRELERQQAMGNMQVEVALRPDGMPLISALLVDGKRLK